MSEQDNQRAQASGQAAGKQFDPTTTAALPDQIVTRITLIRHGDVVRLAERVVRGQTDMQLSELGQRQGAGLLNWFASQTQDRPHAVHSSDLTRCSQLATALANHWQLPAQLGHQWREQNMGHWQGKTWSAIQTEFGSAINDYWDDYVNARPPGGESMRDLSTRVGAAWEQLLETHSGQNVCLVTHVGVIRCLLCRALGVELNQALRFAPATASLTELLVSEAGVVLNTFGERPWLFTDSQLQQLPE